MEMKNRPVQFLNVVLTAIYGLVVGAEFFTLSLTQVIHILYCLVDNLL